MTELAVTVQETHHRWTRVVAVAALLAAVVVTLALAWPAHRGSHVARQVDIPQYLITEAQQERAAWAHLDKVIAEQQSGEACVTGTSC